MGNRRIKIMRTDVRAYQLPFDVEKLRRDCRSFQAKKAKRKEVKRLNKEAMQ